MKTRRSAPRPQSQLKLWRRRVRPRALTAAARAAKRVRWSASLLEMLMEELYIADSLEELLGKQLRRLPKKRYAEAVATALIIRHSWQADDLAYALTRLGLNADAAKQSARRADSL